MIEKPNAETQLFIEKALQEATIKFGSLLEGSHRELSERIRALEKESDRRAGSKAVLMFIAVISGGIVSTFLGVILKSVFK